MKLGKMLTIGLIGSAGIAAVHGKKTEADCSLPKMKEVTDTWVKSQAKALATCSKEPFDKDACLMDDFLADIPRQQVEECLAINPSLHSDPTLNKNALDVILLQKLTEEVVRQQVAKMAKQEKLDRPSTKNHSHPRLHHEL